MKGFKPVQPFYLLFFSYVSGLICSNIFFKYIPYSLRETTVLLLVLALLCLLLFVILLLSLRSRLRSRLRSCLSSRLSPRLSNLSFISIRAYAAYLLSFFIGFSQITYGKLSEAKTLEQITETSLVHKSFYIAEIKEEILAGKKSWKATAILHSIYDDSTEEWKPHREKVAIYFQKNKKAENLLPGDYIVLSANFRFIEAPYSLYMSKKQIYRSSYLSDLNWVNYNSKEKRSFKRGAVKIRKKLEMVLEDTVFSPSETGVAKALFLGDNSDMDSEVQRQYQSAGVVHVLCVSGMHLGIVASVISALFSFLKNKRQKIIKFFIVFASLWFYAYITGLSPSVCRAACMFTFLQIGWCIDRKISVYRSLALSAWLLLLIEPLWLFSVGFQLSYFAVLGIITFIPKTYPKYIEQHKYLKKIVLFLCVSVAAQCATAPLCIYYFNKFPIYFWLGNMLAAPLASVLLPYGLFVVLISILGFIPVSFLVEVLKKGISFMNESVAIIDKLPGASLELTIGILICILLYALMYWAVVAIKSRNKFYLYLCLYSILLIAILT